MLTTLLLAVLTQADAEIPPVDPAIERASFTLPDGFEAELWAADPMIAKPVQMNFGPDGRLWVATSRTYPQVEVGQVGQDQVIVLGDSDGDGVADERTVFADGLLIPTGLVPGDDGCYVANSTELLHLSDTDGDGVADQKKIVLSGFGTEDTHHLIHTFRWDPAQRLSFAQSIYIHSHLETPWGVERLNAGGFWTLRPDSLKADVFAYGMINPWGLAWTDAGQTFATDGAGGEGINYVLPGGYYKTAFEAPRLLSGLNPGSPKHCGLEIVDSPALPDDWRGSFLTCDFRGNRVCRFVIADRADAANIDPADEQEQAERAAKATSGWSSRELAELIKSDFVAFRPIDVKQGPDGAIYIADWYNPIIQHGEVDFRDPRRDRTHGRIWRVTYKGQTVEPTDYTTLTTPELVETLADDWSYARQHARRLLVERGRSGEPVVEMLGDWVRGLDGTAEGYWKVRLQALWVCHGLEQVDPIDLDLMLRCGDADVRAAAYRVLGDLVDDPSLDWLATASDRLSQPDAAESRPSDVWLTRLRQGTTDFSPRVRLEAIRTAADFDSADATAAALAALDHPVDQLIDYALFLTTRQTADAWLPSLAAGEQPFRSASHTLFALRSVDSIEATQPLIDLIASGAVATSDLPATLRPIVQRAGARELADLIRQTLKAGDEPDRLAAVLRAVRGSTRTKGLRQTLAPLADAIAAAPESARLEGLSLLRRLGLGDSGNSDALLDAFAIAGRSDAAIAAIVGTDDASIYESAIARTAADDASRLGPLLAAGATRFPDQTAAATVRSLLGTPAADEPILALLQSKTGPDSLASALGEAELDQERARGLLAVVRRSGQPRPELEQLITDRGGLQDAKRGYTPEALAAIRKALPNADPHRGEAIYRRGELACVKCHAIGGAGGKIGPELRSLGAASPLDYIVESLLAPSARVKEGYNSVLVLTDEGEVLTGVPLSRSGGTLTIRDAEGEEIAIAEDSIEAERPADSLMPKGLLDRLTDAELTDLVAFLASLGREPDFTVQPTPVVRSLTAMTPENRAAYLLRRKRYAAAASEPDLFLWTPVTTRVDGTLPTNDLPLVSVSNRSAAGELGVSFVRVPFAQSDEGPHPFEIDAGDDSQAWIDDEPIDLGSPKVIAAGDHTLTIAVMRGPSQPEAITIRYAPEAAMMHP